MSDRMGVYTGNIRTRDMVYVAVGAPVFSGFKGGVGVLLGVTGGYIIGFLLTGLIACYALGTVWFIYVYSHNSGSIGVLSALSMCVFPFIIPDTVKMILAIMLARRTRTVIR